MKRSEVEEIQEIVTILNNGFDQERMEYDQGAVLAAHGKLKQLAASAHSRSSGGES